jgi:hypothetical protein
VEFIPDEELIVTKTGQVNTALQSETVFTINQKETRKLINQITSSRKQPEKHCKLVRKAARALSGYQESDAQAIDPTLTGRYQGDVIIEKHFIQGTGDYPIPFVLMIPKQATKKSVVLFLDPDGKKVNPGYQTYYETFINNGHIVLIPDLIDTGEMGPTEYRGDATIDGMTSNIWYMAIQNAVSIVGIRAMDVNRLALYLKKRYPNSPVTGASRGHFNAVLLHAAVMNNQIESVVMFDPLLSFQSLVMNPFYSIHSIKSAPAGVLKAYDLPDLAACLAPNPLLMINVMDQNNHSVSTDKATAVYDFARSVYKRHRAEKKFMIEKNDDIKALEAIIDDWLE